MQSSLAWIPLFSLLLCDQAAPQLLDPSCSRTRAEDRIMYGDDASKSDAIYMAAIYNRTHFQCGGTLINRRYVLTAAHCLESRYVLFVHLGAHNRAEPTAWYDVSFGVQHISYNPINKQNDIGLIKLKRRVEYNGRIRPICIYLDKAIKSQVAMVKTFDAFGWGLNEHGQQSDILQTITLNQLNREECRWLGETLSSTQICAGVPGADTCRGDSGGPLSKKIEINKQTFVAQFGIISYGSLTCDSMAVYTDVTSFVDWIQETISRFDDPPEIPPNFQRVPTAPPSVVEKLWLYDDCGGDGENMSSIVQLTIYGPGFKAQGVLITDQFVITVARDLPENAASL
ncbi:chymotrypsin-like protease CTRL-1 [Drosophila rhopaloa]|uniref:Chymotrypsin-2-like n=1 Tax=Drosophila rhopaloa TaxID=1041015 RepID=A0A6P4E2G2_DRORH|nr:chymotrypsin-like protease CTRL-1 [Drosophila rhopaloa]